MLLNDAEKERIKQDLVACLNGEREIRKVVIFGSFLSRPDPNDLDVVVFQDSDQTYLPLALKYRRLLRPIANQIPIDVIPVRRNEAGGWFLREIQKGEVIYEC